MLKVHINKHGEEYPGVSNEQYIKIGIELIQKPVGGNILGHKTKDNIVVRYNKETNDFVKGRPDRGLYTLFKPKEGQAYYNNQRMEDLKHGGKG